MVGETPNPALKAIKYIHKYIYKGHDRATVVVGQDVDEISDYIGTDYLLDIQWLYEWVRRITDQIFSDCMLSPIKTELHAYCMHGHGRNIRTIRMFDNGATMTALDIAFGPHPQGTY